MDIIFFSGFSYPRILASDFLKRDKLHIAKIMERKWIPTGLVVWCWDVFETVPLCSKNLSHTVLPVSQIYCGFYPAWCKLSIYKFGLSVCLFVCLFVCLYPKNVKTAEPIGPKFCVGHHVTPENTYLYTWRVVDVAPTRGI